MKLFPAVFLLATLAHAEVRLCKPTQACWPDDATWRELGSRLEGKLERPDVPPATMSNPFALQEHSGGTESKGWIGAWKATPSAQVVVAKSAADVAAAVEFAHRHKIKLAIKGTGHDYLGRSSAPDSLLVWTHAMRDVHVVDAFVATGCSVAAVPAVSVGAGARWLEVYEEVTTRHHRYVQGGGCTSVGAAGGFLQGGGFGSFSRKYGIAAGSLLEAEVVTADGKTHVANACQDQDLFWALRGGGGGTFGVVTRVVLATHELPKTFGGIFGSIEAKGDAAYLELLEHFVAFYGERMANEHWGEQVRVGDDNVLGLSLVTNGLTQAEEEAAWKPFREWLLAHPDRYTMKASFLAWPAEKMWDRTFYELFAADAIVKAPETGPLWWWRGDGGQVGVTWVAYQSRWLPETLFKNGKLAKILFDASRHYPVELHFNKGQAGASPEAVARDKTTAMSPAVLDAAALAIVASATTHEVDAARRNVSAAMKILRDATPGMGSYVNETDYFEPDWKRSFWGANYARLLQIKRRVDPDGVFTCHHCVGSE